MIRKFWNTGNKNSKKRTTRAGASRRSRLGFEGLEDRRVLTGTADLSGGVLSICGDGNANTIVVAELPDQIFVFADFLGGSQLIDKNEVDSIVIDAGDGADTVVTTSLEMSVQINGEGGNDRIFGGSGGDNIDGGAGDDLIFGNGGDDLIFGRAGADIVIAGNGDDIVNGGDDNDAIAGNDGDDQLNGESGNDTVSGSAGDDTVIGGVGDDTLVGGAGEDTLRGNAGNDTITGDGDSDQLLGEAGDDRLIGAGAADQLIGGSGNDVLSGGLGDDILVGDDGEDQLFGDSGSDTIFGGEDNDTIFAGTGPDMAFGNEGDDVINGGNGFDVLAGHSGEDTLNGGNDRDILIGGEDADILNGQGGDDFNVGIATVNQANATGLESVRDAWTGEGDYDDRVAAALDGLDTESDDAVDQFSGGSGQDAFYLGDDFSVSDRQANELLIGTEVLAVNDSYEASIGETITTTSLNGVLANDIDPNGNSPLEVTVITPTAHGDLTFNDDGSFSYTQTTHARDSFTYLIVNSFGESSVGKASIVVPGIPELPEGAFLTTLASGLQIFDFQGGTGSSPSSTDRVLVTYVGYLPDGTIFDSNTTGASFPLTNLISGFSEGVQGMNVGGRRRFAIPPELGYGPGGNPGAGIGGTDTIIFDVELLDIL